MLSAPIAVQTESRKCAIRAKFQEAQQMTGYDQGLSTTSSKVNLTRILNIRKKGSREQAVTSTTPTVGQEDLANFAYHYPSHCSNEPIVLHFLTRLAPFTTRMIRFQDFDFDVPDRSFHTVSTCWQLATNHVTCVKELTPELFINSVILQNRQHLALGKRQNGNSIDSVQLPPWAQDNPRLFILVNRAALESNLVSAHLPKWINLIFGYQQTGQTAKEAINLYHPFTYYGAINVDDIDCSVRKGAVQAMIRNYGQVPQQLFQNAAHSNKAASLTDEVQESSSAILPIDSVSNQPWGRWLGSPSETQPEAMALGQLPILHNLRLAFWISKRRRIGDSIYHVFEKCPYKELYQYHENLNLRDTFQDLQVVFCNHANQLKGQEMDRSRQSSLSSNVVGFNPGVGCNFVHKLFSVARMELGGAGNVK
ncbi:hypothetical protein Ciccas_003454 [Cichlidogyrus casuarinus]|uniref:BEACH domain-containing protein n=1 Tax=Cichlidogyrus casuarinus TaxID=1844966 RepID=A0ABD2QEC3_9PLAT